MRLLCLAFVVLLGVEADAAVRVRCRVVRPVVVAPRPVVVVPVAPQAVVVPVCPGGKCVIRGRVVLP